MPPLIFFQADIVLNCRKLRKISSFSAVLGRFCNVWFKLGVVHTLLATFHFFPLFLVKSRPTGNFTDYGISLLRRGDGVKFLVYQKSRVKSPGAPSRVCTTPNLNDTLYTFQKIMSIENFLEIFEIAQLLKRKVF